MALQRQVWYAHMISAARRSQFATRGAAYSGGGGAEQAWAPCRLPHMQGDGPILQGWPHKVM